MRAHERLRGPAACVWPRMRDCLRLPVCSGVLLLNINAQFAYSRAGLLHKLLGTQANTHITASASAALARDA